MHFNFVHSHSQVEVKFYSCFFFVLFCFVLFFLLLLYFILQTGSQWDPTKRVPPRRFALRILLSRARQIFFLSSPGACSQARCICFCLVYSFFCSVTCSFPPWTGRNCPRILGMSMSTLQVLDRYSKFLYNDRFPTETGLRSLVSPDWLVSTVNSSQPITCSWTRIRSN